MQLGPFKNPVAADALLVHLKSLGYEVELRPGSALFGNVEFFITLRGEVDERVIHDEVEEFLKKNDPVE